MRSDCWSEKHPLTADVDNIYGPLEARVPDANTELRVISSYDTDYDTGAKWAFVFLWLFTVTVLGRPEDYFKIPFHFQLIFATCAGLTFIAALLTGRTRLVFSSELGLMLLLTVWFSLGVLFAYWHSASFSLLVGRWLRTLLVFFLLVQILRGVNRIRKLMWGVVLSEAVVAFASVVLEGGEVLRKGERLEGFNADMLGWNYFPIAFAMTIPYIAVLYVSRRSWQRTLILALAVSVMMWMLVLTASRGGFLNVSFAVLLTWWCVLYGTERGRVAGIAIISILIIAMILAPGLFMQRIRTIWGGSTLADDNVISSADESVESRERVLSRSIMYTLRYPVFGVGMGNFSVINGQELKVPNAWYGTHNTFTQLSSETGLPGLFLFLSLLLTSIKHMRKIRSRADPGPDEIELYLFSRATIASILSFVFGAFFAHLGYELFIYLPMAIASSLWITAQEGVRLAGHAPEDIPATRDEAEENKWS